MSRRILWSSLAWPLAVVQYRKFLDHTCYIIGRHFFSNSYFKTFVWHENTDVICTPHSTVSSLHSFLYSLPMQLPAFCHAHQWHHPDPEWNIQGREINEDFLTMLIIKSLFGGGLSGTIVQIHVQLQTRSWNAYNKCTILNGRSTWHDV